MTVLTNAYCFSPAGVTYYTNRYSLNLEFHKVAGEDTPYKTFEDQFQHSDFVIAKTGDLGILFPIQERQTQRAQVYFQASPTFSENFEAIGASHLPDGNTATLYASVPKATM